ncbi:hypothetical protein DPMN_025757 [Dreissena polymorpha]|uniref:Uncharacterized protein n=1 Tax=Dreissena polymorpha TaxID=45954 RepID=A0A9D4RCU3_DREPO|nr:hypothetical protein DPMN_025757 [Dreissena polymorpha]
MPRQTPKPVMASTSSTLAAAITRVGMPLSMPYPRSDKFINDGTTTAGDTAASTIWKYRYTKSRQEFSQFLFIVSLVNGLKRHSRVLFPRKNQYLMLLETSCDCYMSWTCMWRGRLFTN